MASPKRITATGQVITGAGIIDAVSLKAGSDTATLTLHDNTAGSSTVLWELTAVTNTTACLSQLNIPYAVGVYATLTGTASSGMVTLK